MKLIANQRHIVAALTAAGYTGGREALLKLATDGETLRRRYENMCSYQWADTPQYRGATTRLERRIAETAQAAGLYLYIQGDCRGATVYVDMKPIPDNNYTQAHCLYTEGE